MLPKDKEGEGHDSPGLPSWGLTLEPLRFIDASLRDLF